MKLVTTGIDALPGVIVEQGAMRYTVRLRIPAGVITPVQMKKVADLADEFGTGMLHLTTRQTIEIPHVTEDDVPALKLALEENGTPIGAEHETVVNITACPGIERCRLANIDSLSLAMDIDRKYFGRDMPVKTRIGVSACPNACVSERLCEVGVTGLLKPVRHPEKCTGCGTCVEYCKEDALEVVNGVIILNNDKCIRCGSCVHTCPYGVITAGEPWYQITFGGKRGRHPKLGRHIITVSGVQTASQVIDILMYRIYRHAISGMLLGDQIDDAYVGIILKEIEQKIPLETIISEW
jgi:anaerobic sulfite reductase subunit C